MPRLDHTTMVLLPDASVLIAGSDRTEPARRSDPAWKDRDTGVPVAQVYKPPYLFKGRRPVIEDAPEEIAYGSTFDLQVSGAGGSARSRSSCRAPRPTNGTGATGMSSWRSTKARTGRLTAGAGSPGACAARVLHAVRPEPRRRAQRGEARPLQRSRMTARA